jgi:hypothetical protein
MSLVQIPEDVFSIVKSFLLDPEYFLKKHQEWWRRIRVKRIQRTRHIEIDSIMGYSEYQTSSSEYFVYSIGHRYLPHATVPKRHFLEDDITGELDNVQEEIESFEMEEMVEEEWDYDLLLESANFMGTEYVWHNYQRDQYVERLYHL